MGDLSERPYVLYRFFDAGGRLLYVGITVNLPNRFARHEAEKDWYGEIARIAVAHFPTREAVLDAEKAAIQAEKPLHNVQHNVQHNGPRGGLIQTAVHSSGAKRWTFQTRSGYKRTTPLHLYWEVNCDPISDNYYVDEIESEDLWREWIRGYPCDPAAEAIYGKGAYRVSWYVEGDGTFESAPFQDLRLRLAGMRELSWSVQKIVAYEERHGFLAHFTWPYDAKTGERVRWAALPVIDKVWRESNLPKGPHAFKGGFIQEATGWKPAALQPFVNIELLAQASGLARPSDYRDRQKGAA